MFSTLWKSSNCLIIPFVNWVEDRSIGVGWKLVVGFIKYNRKRTELGEWKAIWMIISGEWNLRIRLKRCCRSGGVFAEWWRTLNAAFVSPPIFLSAAKLLLCAGPIRFSLSPFLFSLPRKWTVDLLFDTVRDLTMTTIYDYIIHTQFIKTENWAHSIWGTTRISSNKISSN